MPIPAHENGHTRCSGLEAGVRPGGDTPIHRGAAYTQVLVEARNPPILRNVPGAVDGTAGDTVLHTARVVLVLMLMLLVPLAGCAGKPATAPPGTDQRASISTDDHQPDGSACLSLPPGWSVLASDRGAIAEAVFGPDPGVVYAGLADGGVAVIVPGSDSPPVTVGTRRYSAFRVSPDGSRLVGGVSGQLWLLDLSSGVEQALGLQSHGVLAWTSPTAFLFVDASSGAVASYDLGTTRTRHVTGGGEPAAAGAEGPVMEIRRLGSFPAFDGSLSSDATQLLFSQGHSGNAQVVRLDLATGRMYTYPYTSGDGMWPRWEPDGRHALHGYGVLKRLDTLTGAVEELQLGFSAARIGDVSSDGRILAFALAEGVECWVLGTLRGGGR